MRKVDVLRKQQTVRLFAVVNRGMRVCQKGKAWILFLLLSVCLLVVGQLQQALHCTIQGSPVELAWLSDFVLTGVTTFITVLEFSEKRRTQNVKRTKVRTRKVWKRERRKHKTR